MNVADFEVIALILALALALLTGLGVFGDLRAVNGRRYRRRNGNGKRNGNGNGKNGNGTNGNGKNGETSFANGASLMSRRLKAAGLFDVPTWVFLILLVLVGLCGGMLMMELFGNEVVYGIVGFGLAMYLLYVLVRELGRSRARRFEERLVDAVGFMASMASTDGNPVRVLKHAAEVSRKNVRVELREVVRRLGVGMPIYQALSRLVERYDSESVRVFANALASKWQAGGDMVPMMQSVSRLMHERLKHRMQLKSQLGGAQVTSIAAGAMPYLLLLVFMRIYPEWVDRLVSHPVGLGLLFATICLQIVGVLWLQRLTHVEY